MEEFEGVEDLEQELDIAEGIISDLIDFIYDNGVIDIIKDADLDASIFVKARRFLEKDY